MSLRLSLELPTYMLFRHQLRSSRLLSEKLD